VNSGEFCVELLVVISIYDLFVFVLIFLFEIGWYL
jgi:hypothetical protein